MTFITQKEQVETASISFDPEFPAIIQMFHGVIDTMVSSVANLPRVDTLLFQHPDNQHQQPISAIQLHEEIIINAKTRVTAVLQANTYGPMKYADLFHTISPYLVYK